MYFIQLFNLIIILQYHFFQIIIFIIIITIPIFLYFLTLNHFIRMNFMKLEYLIMINM